MESDSSIFTKLLLGPGPSTVPDRILKSMANQTISHLDPDFFKMLDETSENLRLLFETKNQTTFAVSGTGSAGMETVFANLIEKNDKVLIFNNGLFGDRMADVAGRYGANVIEYKKDWGSSFEISEMISQIEQHDNLKIVAIVHAETSTGALTDPESITKLAHDHGCLSIVDTVTGLVGVPLKVDEWGIDAIYSGTQKCLSASPGLSPISFSNAAKEKIKNRKSKVKSWFLDLNLIMSYWEGEGGRSYHHTAPINALYGLHEALVMLSEEGLENSWKRHKENHMQLRQGLEKLNIEFLVKEEDRLPQLNAIYIPDGVNDLESRQKLLNEFNLEIGAGLGVLAGKVWRIGLMGQSSNKKNIEYCLNSLAEVI